MIVMNGVSFGAVLGLIGWPMLQAAGVVEEPAIETVQRKQAASISEVEATVNALNATVVSMGARVDGATIRQEAVSRRMAEIDIAFGTLRTSVDELQTAQSAMKETWREPVAELAAAATKTRGEIVRLRSSVEELTRTRQPDALNARIDRIEQAMVQHNLLGQMRGSIQEPAERPRPAAPRESLPATDGHIIYLSPPR